MIEQAKSFDTSSAYYSWRSRVQQILSVGLNDAFQADFNDRVILFENWHDSKERQVAFLEGLQLKLLSKLAPQQGSDVLKFPQKVNLPVNTNKVFVVHGHDSAIKESVARYLEKIGLEPIILHEQPNGGKTIIEKFEVYADVGFAVVLLTPDDFGGSNNQPDESNARARQNVIMELGYFIGKLGRNRVCALYKKGVEIPSDYQGVLYTEYDGGEGWKMRLAQELNECGFALDLKAIVGK